MNQFWQNLPQDVRSLFDSQSKPLEVKRGEYIYRQGDDPKAIYFVEKGLIGLVVIASGSGHEHLLRFFKQGQFFGHRSLFAEENYHASALALEPTLIKMVPKNLVLTALSEHPMIYKDIVVVLAKELRQSELQRVVILENQILARTAQALVYLKDIHPEHNWTRQEIANFTASTASTIIKALAELEAQGYIEQKGRSIHVLDRDGLIALQDANLA